MGLSDDQSPALADALTVLVIDGPNRELFDRWLDDGTMPNLRRMRDEGLDGTIRHTKQFRNERCWNIFLDGRETIDAGSSFDPQTYRYANHDPGREGATPFYGLAPGLNVCVFDMVAPLVPDLSGLQMLGWGSELNASRPVSLPAGLMEEMCARHGHDPKMKTSYAVAGDGDGAQKRGYRNPSIYSAEDIRRYTDYLLLAIERRTAIALDLIDRQEWDLFLGLYSETHTANHMFWHIANEYPVEAASGIDPDPLREVFRAVDRSVGVIAEHLGSDCAMLAMTIDETGPNRLDVPSMALLPELVWRAEGLGPPALFGDVASGAPAPPRMDYAGHWKEEVWALRTAFGDEHLSSPDALTGLGDPLNWNPAQWYRGLWPRMRAFALPNVSDGHVRINVAGREAHGIVPPEEFGSEVERIREMASRLMNPRTGLPAVERCEVMRRTPDELAQIPPDIVIVWSSDAPIDCMDHPELGRVGPAPFFRSGGHFAHGSTIENRYFATGERLRPGLAHAGDGSLADMAATILGLIGAEPETAIPGLPLIRPAA